MLRPTILRDYYINFIVTFFLHVISQLRLNRKSTARGVTLNDNQPYFEKMHV
jgi:hypothetical protein